MKKVLVIMFVIGSIFSTNAQNKTTIPIDELEKMNALHDKSIKKKK